MSLLIAGCSDSTAPESSSPDLTGTWNFSYVAADSTTPCPVPDLVQGCSGFGTFDLVQLGPRVTGTWTARGGCQTCGGAADYGGSGSIHAVGYVRTLAFGLQGCEFRAELPAGQVDEITGTVSCVPGPGQVARGTWRMTRSP
jgi:hypothetical protein